HSSIHSLLIRPHPSARRPTRHDRICGIARKHGRSRGSPHRMRSRPPQEEARWPGLPSSTRVQQRGHLKERPRDDAQLCRIYAAEEGVKD
ncbi:hypothetical protein PMAYCL1PPCAC_01743, partial [Pristionchus mayeri]